MDNVNPLVLQNMYSFGILYTCLWLVYLSYVSGVSSYPLRIQGVEETEALEGDTFDFNCSYGELINIVDAYYGYPTPKSAYNASECFQRVEPRYFTILTDECHLKNTSHCDVIAASTKMECHELVVNSSFVRIYYRCSVLETEELIYLSEEDKEDVELFCLDQPSSYIQLVDTYSIVKHWSDTQNTICCPEEERISVLDLNQWNDLNDQCHKMRVCNVSVGPVFFPKNSPGLRTCFSSMLHISYTCIEEATQYEIKTCTGGYLDGYLCPYGSLIDVLKATLGATDDSDKPPSSACTRHTDESCYDLIIKKCQGRTKCDNLKALPIEFYCGGQIRTSEYFIIEYQCHPTAFSQTCTEPYDYTIPISCTNGSYIWLDKEFTYLSWSTSTTSINDSCAWSVSNYTNLADARPDIFNNWANVCNMQPVCEIHNDTFSQDYLEDLPEAIHLTVSFTCETGIGDILWQTKTHNEIACTTGENINIAKVRMGTGQYRNILYGCMVDAPVAYVRKVKEACNNKQTCSHLAPPNEVTVCNAWELYTNLTQLTYTCTLPEISETCLFPDGSQVSLDCPIDQSIHLKDSGTVFKYVWNETEEICSDAVADSCDVLVEEYYPHLFMGWKKACNGRRSCILDVSPVDVSAQCDGYCNSTVCNATFVTHSWECLDEYFTYAFANEEFPDQLCFDTTVIDIAEARYGLVNADCTLAKCVPDIAKDCLQFVHSDYLLDIMDRCNGNRYCNQLKALSSTIICDGKKTYSDYVVLYYRCIDGNSTEPDTTTVTETTEETTTTYSSTTSRESTTEVEQTTETQLTTTTPGGGGLSHSASLSIVAVISAVIGALLVIIVFVIVSKTRKKSDDNDASGKHDQKDFSPVEELRYETTPGQADFYESLDARSVKPGELTKVPEPKKPHTELEDSLNTDAKHCYYNYSAFPGKKSSSGATAGTIVSDEAKQAKHSDSSIKHISTAEQQGTDMVDSAYYAEDDGTDWVDNTYYEDDEDPNTDSRPTGYGNNGGDLVDNTYYDGGQGEPLAGSAQGHIRDHTGMIENTYYGDDEDPREDFVENNYYESQVAYPKVGKKPNIKPVKPTMAMPGSGTKAGTSKEGGFETSGEHYYDLKEYKPKVTKFSDKGRNKPAVAKKPKPTAKPTGKEKLGHPGGNYAYTYQHFGLEGRDREPAYRDSNI